MPDVTQIEIRIHIITLNIEKLNLTDYFVILFLYYNKNIMEQKFIYVTAAHKIFYAG